MNLFNFVRNLINKITEPSEPPATNPQQKFLVEILQAVDNNPSPENIFPLLAANQQLLDMGFVEALQAWAKLNLAEKQGDAARNFVIDIFTFSNRISDFPLGRRADNLEIAIAGYEIASTFFTPDAFPQDWATTQNNLGTAYSNRIWGDKGQNLEQAIACYQAALTIRTPDAFPQDWATTQNNLGTAYSNRIWGDKGQNLEDAIACYQAALTIYTPDAFPQAWATTQNNLGTAYSDRIRGDRGQNIEDAIACYQAALTIRTPDAFPQDWAMTQNNLGAAYRNRIWGDKGQNLEQAIACYQAALTIYTPDAFPQAWATTQNNLGTAYSDRIRGDRGQNIEDAIACYQAALTIYTPDAFPQNHADTSFNLGLAYQDANKLTEAYQTFKSAITTVEFLRGEIVSGNAAKQQHAEEWNKLYRRMVEVCLQLDKQQEALQYVERSKTQNLVELIVQQIITQQLQPLESDIANEQLKQKKAANPNDSLLKDLENRRQTVLQQKPNLSTINFADTQQLLDEHTAIVQWYIFADCFRTFIITRHHPQPIIWQSSEADLTALETWKTEYLDSYTADDKNKWRIDLNTCLEALAQILQLDTLLNRLQDEFPNCQSLILVPHRYLHLVPLHALPLNTNEYLLDKFPGGVRYAPSCTLLKFAENGKRQGQFNQLFAINNPNNDLTYTNIEVATIRRHFPESQVLSTSAATKQAVLEPATQQKLETSPYLHFSCHGYFNWKTPLNSALALAGCRLSPAPEDSDNNQRYLKLSNGDVIDIEKCLSLADIFNLELSKCHLVTLSACETGISNPFNSSDEYVGLPSGFLKAGSSSVISSLWNVDDFSTALLMMRFYQNLKKSPTCTNAMALKEAQCWLRNATQAKLIEWTQQQDMDTQHQQAIIEGLKRRCQQDDQPFDQPFFWAAFCSIGV